MHLEIYKTAYSVCIEFYKLIQKYPKEEIYGLVSQMRRAAVSIPSNISEGYKRNSKKEFEHFLYISLGSIGELETQIKISKDLEYILKNECENIIEKLNSLEEMIH
ncbi:four helix bundle protein [Candidatus Dependentiae bacterium]|nr:four helix bundle protein [Candidatus Dependentiae bacterium]